MNTVGWLIFTLLALFTEAMALLLTALYPPKPAEMPPVAYPAADPVELYVPEIDG